VLTIVVAQSTCKALIVDTLPIEKQQLGAAWGAYVFPILGSTSRTGGDAVLTACSE